MNIAWGKKQRKRERDRESGNAQFAVHRVIHLNN